MRERVESPGTYVTRAAIFAWPCDFRTALSCSGDYHLESGGIYCKNGATTENRGAGVKYMG